MKKNAFINIFVAFIEIELFYFYRIKLNNLFRKFSKDFVLTIPAKKQNLNSFATQDTA